MKYRNHKTGEVYDSMVKTPCPTHNGCGTCEYKPFVGESCTDFCRNHPSEAAHLMGYEVVEDEEEAMEKKDKPRICEVLGVADMEPFGFASVGFDIRVNAEKEILEGGPVAVGDVWSGIENPTTLYAIIFHPDRIIRKPRFTEEEMAVLNALQRAGVTEIERGAEYNKLEAKSRIFEDGVFKSCKKWFLPPELLPSLRPGRTVRLEDILKEGESLG